MGAVGGLSVDFPRGRIEQGGERRIGEERREGWDVGGRRLGLAPLVLFPVADCLAELAVGECFVADPRWSGHLGLAEGRDMEARDREGDPGGEELGHQVDGSIGGLDVGDQPGSEVVVELRRKRQNAGPSGLGSREGGHERGPRGKVVNSTRDNPGWRWQVSGKTGSLLGTAESDHLALDSQ